MHAPAGEDAVDHSREAVHHAQHLANLLVDEARLSPNRYEVTNDETERLIANHDIRMVTLPSPHSFSEEETLAAKTYRTELYLL